MNSPKKTDVPNVPLGGGSNGKGCFKILSIDMNEYSLSLEKGPQRTQRIQKEHKVSLVFLSCPLCFFVFVVAYPSKLNN